jgi:hypothetical protein
MPSKTAFNPSRNIALTAYLSPRSHFPPGIYFESSLSAILRDARGATGRDDEGVLPPDRAHEGRSWLGALGYLCLIDQVGTAVRPKRVTTIPLDEHWPPSFVRGLARFAPDLVSSPLDRAALYGVRCALAHDFSLVNMGNDGRVRGEKKPPRPGTQRLIDRLHVFNYTFDPERPLVDHAVQLWRRTTWTPRPEQMTVVNLYKVGNLAESIVATAQAMHVAGRLTINDEYVRSPRELMVRYGLSYRE